MPTTVNPFFLTALMALTGQSKGLSLVGPGQASNPVRAQPAMPGCGPEHPGAPVILVPSWILGLNVEELIKRSRAYKSRTPRTSTQILLQGTARYLTDAKITLSLDQAQELLKIIRGQIKALANAVTPPMPRKSRSKKSKQP